MASRLVIVSNRLPVSIHRRADSVYLEPYCDGLVKALRPLLKGGNTCWIGGVGPDAGSEAAGFVRDYAEENKYSFVPVFLSLAETAELYEGCCSRTIWPLFHGYGSHCDFSPMFWAAYREANETYADTVDSVVREDDVVWVQDYHLMMLADALRARESRFNLSYFHHIPFPPPDTFEHLPFRNDILRGLLQFNTIGFQTLCDRKNFVASLRRCLHDVHVRGLGDKLLVCAEGLCARVGVFPISIDYDEIAAAASTTEIAAEAKEIQRALAPCRIVLAVDRLDRTKGIPERLLGFRTLLEDYPELHGLISLVQIVGPSREGSAGGDELKRVIERLVSETNGKYGGPEWIPVHYCYRWLSRPELLAYYRAADIVLLTPLKAGMNLVAKEFCASRIEEDGVLVLSEFTGAAAELRCGALLVNPHDAPAVAAVLYRAFRMGGREQHVRMWRMRHHLRRHDVFRWRDSFCQTRGTVKQPGRAAPETLRALGDIAV